MGWLKKLFGSGGPPREEVGIPVSPERLQQAGQVDEAKGALTEALEGILRRHPAPEQQAVQPRAGGEPVLYVASEINKMPPGQRSGSHFLGVFPGQGHMNLGASDDWADLDKFEARALSVAREQLARG